MVREHHPDTVFVACRGIERLPEILDVLVDHLTGTWPEHFCRRGSVVQDGLTGESVAVDGQSLHPLDAASRLVQEDLVVMVEQGDRLCSAPGPCASRTVGTCAASSVCHCVMSTPVSLLNDQLGDTIDKFLARLTPERSFWRLGWGVLDSVDLYQPVDGTAAPRPARPVADDIVVRVERALRRVPRTGVLFTIRTHITKAADLAADPKHAPVIAEALAAMPSPVRRYKQIDQVAEALGDLFGELTLGPDES